MRSGGGTLGAPVHGTHSVDVDHAARIVVHQPEGES